MDKPTSPKQKLWISIGLIALALLIIVIIFKDEFSNFLSYINNKLSVLNSLIIGVVLAYLLNPIVRYFNRLYRNIKSIKTQKVLSIFSAYFVVIGFFILFIVICVPQVVKSFNELPIKLKEFLDILTVKLTAWYDSFKLSDFYASFVELTGSDIDINEIINSLMETYVNIDTFLNKVTEYAIVFLGKLYTGISDTFIGIIFSVYVIASKENLKAQAKKITTAICPPKYLDGVFDAVRYTDQSFGGFIQGKLIDAVIISILTFISFWIFDIPYPVLLSIIIGITDIIPIFGPFIGAIPSTFIVLIAAPEKVIIMLLLILIIQQVDGNYIGPKILGESTGLSALGVFASIIIMGGYFGIIGMLIGVPTFAVAQYLITKAVDKKLNERGVSTELDSYYTCTIDASPHENKRLFKKIVDPFIKLLKSIIFAIIKFFKNLPKIKKRNKVTESKEDSSSNRQNKNTK